MKVAMMLANGFETVEAFLVVDILRRAQIAVTTMSIHEQLEVTSSHQVTVLADALLDDSIYDYDMILLPGGMPGATNLRDDHRVIEAIQYFHENDRYIGAICAAPIVLAKAGIETNKNLTSYPDDEYKNILSKANYIDEAVVIDGKLITSRGPATTFDYAYAIIELLGVDSETLKNGMLYTQYIASKK